MDPISAALGVGGIASNIITNASNQRNFERSLEFQRYMYEDSKHYNSASEQVKRLRAAGMNPAFAFGNNAGQITAGSTPSALPQQPLDLNGLSAISSGVNLNRVQAHNIEADTSLKSEEATGKSIDNKFNADEHLARISNLNIDKGLKQVLIKGAVLQNLFAERSMNDRLRQQSMQSQLLEAQATAQFYTNQYLPQKLQASIEHTMALAKSALQNGAASLTQAHAAIMNATNQQHAFDAQYGGTPDAREKFSKAAYSYLLEQTESERSNQFKNYSFEQLAPFPSRRAQFDPKSGKWYEQSVAKRNPIFRFGSW